MSYKGILDNILIEFSAKKLKQISIFRQRIIDGENTDKSGYYLEKINITYPTLCANDCKREILNLISYLNINFQIIIKLFDCRYIKYIK